MAVLRICSLAGLLSLLACQSSPSSETPSERVQFASLPSPELTPETGFALIELFTSQGCSSCPPADRLLAKLSETYADQPVFGLSFHVDYWNRLGWEDPYSKADFSRRQRQYARRLDGRVYTPQMVVNGQVGFVGSRRTAAEAAIEAALQQAPSTQIELTILERSEKALSLNYQVINLPQNGLLHLALVEPERTNPVPRGENHGRTLAHTNVVHEFQSFTGSTSGTLQLPLSAFERPEEAVLVAYSQAADSWKVTGLNILKIR